MSFPWLRARGGGGRGEGAVSMSLCESYGRFLSDYFGESQLKEFLCGSTVEEDLTGEIVRNDGFNGLKSSKISSERSK